jgi:hypothetical protein
MRQIEINELSPGEVSTIAKYLKEHGAPGALEGMFWIPLPENIRAGAQQGHGECGPFVFAVELLKDAVVFELLVRSSSNLHCTCTSYATAGQRQYVLDFFDAMVLETHIAA